MAPPTDKHTLQLLWGFALFLLVSAGASALWGAHGIEEHNRELARVSAGAYFDSVVAARRWNALHGGVYVPVTEQFQPNPYLEDPLRDLETTDGLHLTKVNPAYMTRLIAGIEARDHGVTSHITSLKPIRPANGADPWETAALEGFEQGKAEIFGVVDGPDDAGTYRYMKPLATEKVCLKCHAKQGYEEGDIRGGISVSFPYGPFAEAGRHAQGALFLGHLLFLVMGWIVVALLGGRLLRARLRAVEAEEQVERLEGILPICCHCKKIRRDGGDPAVSADWSPVEVYVGERSDADFSHSICPECMVKFYPEYNHDP